MPNRALPHLPLSATYPGWSVIPAIPVGIIRRRAIVAALFLGAPLLFSVNMVVARAMGGTVPPLTLAFGRWLVAALLLLPFVLPSLRQGLLDAGMRRRLVVPVLLGGVFSVAPQYAAAGHTSAGNIALIFAATPLLVAVLERVFWAVHLRGRNVAGACLGAVGIAVMTFEGDLGHVLSLQGNPGDLLALGAALAWASYTARLRHCPVELPPLVFLWAVAMGAALVLAPAALAEWSAEGVPQLGLGAWGGILCLAVVAGICAYLVYNRLVQVTGPGMASLSMYLMPIYALGLAALILGEGLHPYHGAALALIVGGVVLGGSASGQAPRNKG